MSLHTPRRSPGTASSNSMRAAALAALTFTGACDGKFNISWTPNPTTDQTVPAQNVVAAQPGCAFVTRYAPDYPNCSNQSRQANGGSCEIPVCVSERINDITHPYHQPAMEANAAEEFTRRQIRGYCALLELASRNGRFNLIVERGGYCAPIPSNQ